MTNPQNKSLIYAAALAGVMAPLLFGMRSLSLDGVTYGLHMTARVSLAYFLVVYFARPLRDLLGVKWLMRYRRTLGLCVAIALTVHFGFVAAFFYLSTQSVFDDMARFYAVSAGAVALYAMAITSNDTSMRVLKRWWKRLHVVGIHYLWFTFFVSYLIAVQKEPDLSTPHAMMFLAFLGVMMLGLGLRVFFWIRRRLARARVAASARASI